MMPGAYKSEHDPDRPRTFQIRIKGHLGQQWMDWFDGLTIALEEDGNTLISGLIVDQSALHGTLKRIRDLGMPLLSVSSDDSDQAGQALHKAANNTSQVNDE
jgi:hypothetical protein